MHAIEEVTPAVDVDRFKRSKNILAEDGMNDALFADLLIAAQDVVETASNRPLTVRRVHIDLRAKHLARWYVPCAPVVSVEGIEWFDGAEWVPVDPALWRLQFPIGEPQIVFMPVAWAGIPLDAEMRVTATVGAASERPFYPLEQAVILMAGDWFEAGIDPDKAEFAKVAFGVTRLLKQNRYRRPCEWAVA